MTCDRFRELLDDNCRYQLKEDKELMNEHVIHFTWCRGCWDWFKKTYPGPSVNSNYVEEVARLNDPVQETSTNME